MRPLNIMMKAFIAGAVTAMGIISAQAADKLTVRLDFIAWGTHAAMHLEHFLRTSPNDAGSQDFRQHAERTLDRLKGITPPDGMTSIKEQQDADGGNHDGAYGA